MEYLWSDGSNAHLQTIGTVSQGTLKKVAPVYVCTQPSFIFLNVYMLR